MRQNLHKVRTSLVTEKISAHKCATMRINQRNLFLKKITHPTAIMLKYCADIQIALRRIGEYERAKKAASSAALFCDPTICPTCKVKDWKAQKQIRHCTKLQRHQTR
jgi:hypothetical protein